MKLILFLTSLLLLTNLNAQDNDYSLIIDKKFYNQLLDIRQDYDRDITAVGFIKKYNTTKNKSSYNNAFDYLASVSGANGTQMQLIKANASGKLVLDKSSALSQFSEAIAITKTPPSLN